MGKKIDVKVLLIIGLAVSLLFIGWRNSRNKANFQEQKVLAESLNAKLVTWKDKEGVSRARIQAIETARAKDFLAIESTNQSVQALQNTVKKFEKQLKNSGNATVFETKTVIDTVIQEVIVESKDTVKIGDLTYVYPEYSKKFNLNDWIKGGIKVDRQQLTLDSIGITNKYAVVIGEESQGWFKKPKPFVDVSNENPYSETVALRAFKVSDKKKKRRLGLGGYVGYGITRTKDGTVVSGFQTGGGLIFKFTF